MTAKSAAAAARSTVYGYPRQGQHRELKKAVEGYWKGRVGADALKETAAGLRRANWAQLAEAGIDEVPTGDFSYYDHVLDTSVMVGAVPPRHRAAVDADPLDGYFAMARGNQDVAPLEMTKWFDTNYHYLVPELGPDTVFTADSGKQVAELAEALALGHTARPVLVGPVTYLLLAKPAPGVAEEFEPLTLLDRLLPVYAEVLGDLRAAGAEWVQLDEPALVQDRTPAELNAAARAYRDLGALTDRPKLLVASYFDRLGEALPVLAKAPVEGLALDFTEAAAANLDDLAAVGGLPGKRLVAGVVNGRNIWINDHEKSLATLATLLGLAGRVDVAASCSLLHVPLDTAPERELDPQILRWLAFARQKTAEIVTLAKGLAQGTGAIGAEIAANRAALASRADSPLTRDPAVRARTAAVTEADARRPQPYPERAVAQRERLRLPLLPTTTIGSFPQTGEVRAARADLRAGRIDAAGYEERIAAEIAEVIAFQEKAGIDVLVHGEAERNDMVQYFAEQLTGYLATRHGWVQSYGTRYVRPPVLAGDISRPAPMTVGWTTYAQSLTERPVKGMLTGPVTMLAWSFVRDDQPLGETAAQVALALRDEVADLEAAGTAVIQVDEPALRETLPLRAADRPAYLAWATRAFRLTTGGVAPATQIHTHMCYAEFGDIVRAIDDLDADVISLEAARSHMEVAHELAAHGYPREAGPGVYDIHSPRVPGAEEAAALLREGLAAIPAGRLWVNPDCGLKTRGWPETRASLENLVAAARTVRAALDAS
ncbi:MULTISPECIES: 5-methyltetrahydropteroyltriglutamate--homocysteine S-methyltransferase [Streptomyces]|uniref:5-methyltetrahydropteroyltriglutamate--homocysteine methyltransferase n=2 Tax=Streptomyces albidoflavus group TaxID=1477431 RepID=A0A7Y6C832_9ACTN|nr:MULTISPECIES: 5-methyltetrahydropteroyltriglutamate--homocysteine S-methyltransferase [Streptomyces]NUV37876.1 5-methyltetrahydropteroyltriglutamate--homocysteine S-methyltransferase [Streptomyces sp. KAI-27]NUV46023.1 5-methyltetrahydropteroyltriglutamate--homocysteine S-methyltransferase [Streptomyces sp. CAI-78]MCQ9707857.1 5-methyltetrahydropteroyltriglutamate--homocysteine S-methyltransferase [Streptomyces sp. BSP1]NUV28731.1 5-methyltetrahydropteroyltriglutamate--homocysteine S-methylt